ncbi:MAG: CaiB/BaiF CoA transferase family protein [Rhodospirillaceae bacterium]
MPYNPQQACPLDGVRVLDLSRLVAGNMLSLQLADFGAEVIKIEPGAGDTLRQWTDKGIAAYWKVYARNKKSIRLDLRDAADKAKLAKLVPSAHILIEAFRPGVMEAMGFGPEALLGLNPRLVIARISGWGQSGPYRDRPGFGTLVEAASGFAAKNGFADKPPSLPNLALADMIAGLSGAFGVMVALREAEKPDGKGQVVDISLLEPIHSILGPDAAQYRINGEAPSRASPRVTVAAPRSVYATSDRKWVALSASTQGMAERLFKAIGRADMITDPRFRTNSDRLDNAAALDGEIQAFIGKKTLAETLAFFGQAEITIGAVHDASGFADDLHVKGRGILVEVPDADIGQVPMHDVVPRLSRTPGAIRRPAPALGAHEDEILKS